MYLSVVMTKMLLVNVLQFLILPMLTAYGLDCDKSKWTCSDYMDFFENNFEETLECLLRYETKLTLLEEPIHFQIGLSTRKIINLNTDSQVI